MSARLPLDGLSSFSSSAMSHSSFDYGDQFSNSFDLIPPRRSNGLGISTNTSGLQHPLASPIDIFVPSDANALTPTSRQPHLHQPSSSHHNPMQAQNQSQTQAQTPQSQVPAASPAGSTSVKRDLVKTELCLNYKTTGHCPYGDRCFFAHGEGDLRSRTRAPTFKSQPCPDPVRTGLACQYASRCHFCHPGEALRRATDCPKDKYFDDEYDNWMRREFGDQDAPWGVYV